MITRARASALIFGGSLIAASRVPACAQTAAPVTILGAGPAKALLDALVPAFEKVSRRSVVVRYPGLALTNMITAGEPFDVVIAPAGALGALVKGDWVLPDSQAVLGSSIVCLAYRSGTPAPDISTPAALKAVVLNAKAISYSDPAAGGPSTLYFAGLIGQLGIAEDVQRKAILTKIGAGAVPVGDGRADVGIAQTTEIALVPGVTGVPLNPSDPRTKTTFSAGVAAKSANADAARAFVRFLLTPDALAVAKASGFVQEP